MIELDNQKDKIAIIAKNQNLLDLLEESFSLYGKFSTSIFTNNSILDFIKKSDDSSVLIVSNDTLDNNDDKHMNFFRENEKKSIFLINKKDQKVFLSEKEINPKLHYGMKITLLIMDQTGKLT